MHHKPDIVKIRARQHNKHEGKSRKDRIQEILDMIKDVCKKFGGCATVGEGYVIVDTKKFDVREK